MLLKINNIQNKAKIKLPASKSLSNRELLINVLIGSRQMPDNLSDSDDTKVMIAGLQTLQNTHDNQTATIDVGAAGTSMRFLTALLALKKGSHFITGSERMKNRPIGVLVEALRSLGADIQYAEKEGFPPLKINGGKLKGGVINLPGNISSQYISALLMIAPELDGGLTIKLEGKVVSQPYIHMTLKTMEYYGVSATWDKENNQIIIPEGKYTAKASSIESDWSASSYWYAIAALLPDCEISLTGLREKSLQGDSAANLITANLGVSTTFTNEGITLKGGNRKVDFLEYDFNSQPDLAQTYVVLCCLLGVKFKFTGLESLKIKETDRITALKNELKKVGFTIGTNDCDTIWWDGGETVNRKSPEPIATYKDHRMAMAMALCAFKMDELDIQEPEVVSKSYPNFWNDLKLICSY